MNLNTGRLTINEITLSVKTFLGNEIIQRNKIDHIKYYDSKIDKFFNFIPFYPLRFSYALRGLFKVETTYRQTEHGKQKKLTIWLSPLEISFLKAHI